MAKAADAQTRLGLVGTGTSLARAIEVLKDAPTVRIAVVADGSDRSEGVKLARSLELPVVRNAMDVFRSDANIVLEINGDERQYERLLSIKPPGVEVMSVRGARLLIQLLSESGTDRDGVAAAAAVESGKSRARLASLGSGAEAALRGPGAPDEAARVLLPAVAAAAGMELAGFAELSADGFAWLGSTPESERLAQLPADRLRRALAGADPVWLARPVQGLGTAGLVPLRVGDETLGLLVVAGVREDALDAEELTTLRLGADLLAATLGAKRPPPPPVTREIPVEIIREVVTEVVKEVPVEVEREVVREVLKEVPVEVVKEVVREVPIEVPREVIKEVPVEVEREVVREVLKEVPVEVVKEVVREVPVEVVKEVVKEIPVDREVVKEVPVEVVREVVKEIVRDVPVEVVKEVVKEVQVPVEVFRDTTQVDLEETRRLRRRIEELETAQEQLTTLGARVPVDEKMQALLNMAGGVGHVFNNVLAGILGRTQLLLKRASREKSKDLANGLNEIEAATRSGIEALTRIQAFSRSRPVEAFGPVDLNDVVQRAVEQTRAKWRDEPAARGIRIELITHFGPHSQLIGAESELLEAVVELIANAVVAMPRGGTLTIRTGLDAGRGVISVSDTGLGMEEGIRRRAFEPFFSTKGETGLGLGLAMVYGVTARHGGEATIESAEGQGTTVTLRIPTSGEGAPVQVNIPESDRPQVLVVDDDETVRAALGDVLRGAGYAITLAASGLEGIARVRERESGFDLVITDLGMPDVPGWEVVEATKQVDPATPVVIMSGFDRARASRRAKELGVDFVIGKPFDLQEFLTTVRGLLLGRKRA
jgi:signal transduction histidine kinase/CheY-like chemotaxis protein